MTRGECITPIEVLGVLEFENTAIGYFALDAAVKAAPVDVLNVSTINPGKLLIFLSGDVASVESSIHSGALAAGESLVESLVLPWVHEEVVAAVMPQGRVSAKYRGESVAVFDASTITSGIEAADRAVKETGISIDMIRFDDAMGGRVSVRFSGDLHDLEVALETVRELLEPASRLVRQVIIANPHPDMMNKVAGYET